MENFDGVCIEKPATSDGQKNKNTLAKLKQKFN